MLQIVDEPPLKVGVEGEAEYVIVEVAVLVHPVVFVPVTVYVLVAVRVDTTVEPVETSKSVMGDHE